jgi:hypothetical protein
MLAILLAFPLFLMLVVLQSAIVSATPLLQGTADLILLTIVAWTLQEQVQVHWQWTIIGCIVLGFISKSPLVIILFAYLAVTAIVAIARRKLWKVPYLAMWTMTLIGTVIVQVITLLGRWLEGADIPFLQAFNLILLPSLMLNLLLAAPVLALVHDLANWLYPQEMEV